MRPLLFLLHRQEARRYWAVARHGLTAALLLPLQPVVAENSVQST